jgi:hypothetical protein
MHIRNPVEWILAQLRAPAALGSASAEEYWPAATERTEIRKIKLATLAAALRLGLADFAASRTDILFAALIYPVVLC